MPSVYHFEESNSSQGYRQVDIREEGNFNLRTKAGIILEYLTRTFGNSILTIFEFLNPFGISRHELELIRNGGKPDEEVLGLFEKLYQYVIGKNREG